MLGNHGSYQGTLRCQHQLSLWRGQAGGVGHHLDALGHAALVLHVMFNAAGVDHVRQLRDGLLHGPDFLLHHVKPILHRGHMPGKGAICHVLPSSQLQFMLVKLVVRYLLHHQTSGNVQRFPGSPYGVNNHAGHIRTYVSFQ